MPPVLIQELNWRSLTELVQNVKPPATFLRDMLFPQSQTMDTRNFEIEMKTRARRMAPFVRDGADALLISNQGTTKTVVAPPNIAIKKAFTPSPLLFGRLPGTTIYPSGAEQNAAIRAYIAEEIMEANDMVTNSIEYLCSQALQGKIAVSDLDNEVYTATFARSGATNITLSTFWDDATPANVDFHAGNRAVEKVMLDLSNLVPTDCILGSEAADAFVRLVSAGRVVLQNVAGAAGQIIIGSVDFTTKYNDAGVKLLGRVDGINFWEYRATVELNGVAQNLIRPKYAEYVSTNPRSDRRMYYGAIGDMTAFQGNAWKSERFAKAWMQEEPSAMFHVIKSNPIPVPRRPDATVSVKVVSG